MFLVLVPLPQQACCSSPRQRGEREGGSTASTSTKVCILLVLLRVNFQVHVTCSRDLSTLVHFLCSTMQYSLDSCWDIMEMNAHVVLLLWILSTAHETVSRPFSFDWLDNNPCCRWGLRHGFKCVASASPRRRLGVRAPPLCLRTH
jgi:hypothetical protein